MPDVPAEVREAERVAKQMYGSLTQARAPKATPSGYIMGATTVLKMLIEQAVQNGCDKEQMKTYALNTIMSI